MAKLKSLRLKNKTYVFTSFDNDKDAEPATVIFSRFPLSGETFTKVDRKNLLDGIDLGKIGDENVKEQIAGKIVETFMENMSSGSTDYERFISECVDHFEAFEYAESKVITTSDFWQILPVEAASTIAAELYKYAGGRDEFTMGESSA